MTKGMKSSEFWMSVIAVLLKWIGPHLGLEFPTEAFYAVASYAVGRGLAKHAKLAA